MLRCQGPGHCARLRPGAGAQVRGAGLQLLWVPDSGRRCGSGRAERLGCATPGSSLAIGPRWVAKSSARGRPGVPVAAGAEGADPVGTGEGRGKHPGSPAPWHHATRRASSPVRGCTVCSLSPPRSPPRRVAPRRWKRRRRRPSGEQCPDGFGRPSTPHQRAGDSRVPQPYHALGASRALGETETPERVETILCLLR